MDPKEQTEDHDKFSVPITLGIIFIAFIVSPMTECLGPVLELNVSGIVVMEPHQMVNNLRCRSLFHSLFLHRVWSRRFQWRTSYLD